MHKKDMSEQQCVAECCEVEEIHPHLLQEALAKMPSPEELNDLAELFKTFGDPTRIRMFCSKKKYVFVIWRPR